MESKNKQTFTKADLYSCLFIMAAAIICFSVIWWTGETYRGKLDEFAREFASDTPFISTSNYSKENAEEIFQRLEESVLSGKEESLSEEEFADFFQFAIDQYSELESDQIYTTTEYQDDGILIKIAYPLDLYDMENRYINFQGQLVVEDGLFAVRNVLLNGKKPNADIAKLYEKDNFDDLVTFKSKDKAKVIFENFSYNNNLLRFKVKKKHSYYGGKEYAKQKQAEFDRSKK